MGKGEDDLLRVLFKDFYLDELALSMAKNGYFDEEPLVGVPLKLPKALTKTSHDSKEFRAFINESTTQFIIVEGNRRLATAKILLDDVIRKSLKAVNWPSLSESVAADLAVLPTIVYVTRSEVTPYLGVRHIVGIQKWDPYAKARYVASMIADGQSVPDIESQIGDKQGAVTKNYVAYLMLEQAAHEFDFDVRSARGSFSLLILAIGQGKIKRFLDLPRRLADVAMPNPVPQSKVDALREVLTWIFGDGTKRPVITDSREITDFLSHIVASEEALDHLRATGDLVASYDRSDGEEILLMKLIKAANSKLEGALGVAHRHKIPEALIEALKSEESAKALVKTLRSSDGA